jgi:hypothetical protein
LRKCGKALTHIFTRTISLVEKVIEEELSRTHREISNEVAQLATDAEAAKFYQENGVCAIVYP